MRSFNRSVFALLFAAGMPTLWAQPASSGGSGPIKIGGITVTGSLRSRRYVWDWFEPTSRNNNYVFRQPVAAGLF